MVKPKPLVTMETSFSWSPNSLAASISSFEMMPLSILKRAELFSIPSAPSISNGSIDCHSLPKVASPMRAWMMGLVLSLNALASWGSMSAPPRRWPLASRMEMPRWRSNETSSGACPVEAAARCLLNMPMPPVSDSNETSACLAMYFMRWISSVVSPVTMAAVFISPANSVKPTTASLMPASDRPAVAAESAVSGSPMLPESLPAAEPTSSRYLRVFFAVCAMPFSAGVILSTALRIALSSNLSATLFARFKEFGYAFGVFLVQFETGDRQRIYRCRVELPEEGYVEDALGELGVCSGSPLPKKPITAALHAE